MSASARGRLHRGFVLLTLAAVAGCGRTPEAPAGGGTAALPFPDDPTLWPSVREERIRTLLGPAMVRAGVDSWVVFARENANDPIATHIGAENAGGLAAFLFFVTPAGQLSSLAISPSSEATALAEVTPLDTVMSIPRDASAYEAAAAVLAERNPGTIAVNSSDRNVADGLSWTQRRAFEAALSPSLRARLVSAGDLVVEGLSGELPREVDTRGRAAARTERLALQA